MLLVTRERRLALGIERATELCKKGVVHCGWFVVISCQFGV